MTPPDEEAARIPFNRASIVGSELDYILEAVDQGHASSGGDFTRRCSKLLIEGLGAADVLLTTSCTDALEMSALLLDIQPDDVVIVPSFTFVSTALAFARAGATIRFADIERETLGIDPESVAALMDERVRAVVPVHYAGIGCDMAGLSAVIPPDVDIIEDNAHGLFGTLDGRQLGSFGRFSTLSFHETKNFSCGEGGALVLNHVGDVDRAHHLLDKGTNRRSFMLGQVDKYTWVDTGSSFGLSDLLAAYLLGQLERRDDVLARREAVWRAYDARLRPNEDELDIACMRIPAGRTCAWHMYYVLTRNVTERDFVLNSLMSDGVHATFHYVPLHSSPGGRHVSDDVEATCPTADDVSQRLIRLPFHNGLTEAEQDRVISSLVSALESRV